MPSREMPSRERAGSSHLQHYQADEHLQVWGALLALDAGIRNEPVYSDTLAFACKTMRRVCRNSGLQIPRLRELGYEFGSGWAIRRDTIRRSGDAAAPEAAPSASDAACTWRPMGGQSNTDVNGACSSNSIRRKAAPEAVA